MTDESEVDRKALEYICDQLSASDSSSVHESAYRAHYNGTSTMFHKHVWALNQLLLKEKGIKLKKDGDYYRVKTPEEQISAGDRHGVKAIRQKQYQVNTFEGVTLRADANDAVKSMALGKRDKAAAGLVDLKSKQRRKARLNMMVSSD